MRKYGSDEYEFYAQDSWKIGQNLTVTAGLRYSLFSPPWETNGQQVAPNIDLGDLLELRGANMRAGIPDNTVPLISFDLAGPANGRPGFYDWDKNNFAPRFAAAWTPKADGGFFGWLTGGDKMVIRGGYSLVYDRIGQSLATRFDQVGSFGLSTQLSSPVNENNEDNPDIRFQGINVIPSTLPAAPPGGFPQTPPVGETQITSALDSSIKTPYSHTFNIVVGRDLGHDFTIEGAYVGRLGRNLLMRRDLMMPLNFTDTQSGVDYFTAARQLIEAARASGDPLSIAPIAYWENLFPDAAFDGFSATQNMASWFMDNEPDWITALWVADQFGFPAFPRTGQNTFLNAQYGFARGAELHRPLAVQRDAGDAPETLEPRVSVRSELHPRPRAGPRVIGREGQLLHDRRLQQRRLHRLRDRLVGHRQAVGQCRLRHPASGQRQLGGGLAVRPGQGNRHDSSAWVNAIIGDWSVAGLWRWTSGFPFNVQNCRSCWATNWNLQGNAELVTPGVLPETSTTKNAVDGLPSPFTNPEEAASFFRRAFPGESGLRNVLRGDGYFTIDMSLAKGWSMPWSQNQKVRFRWDIFNLTNTAKFDIGDLTATPDRVSTFGAYNSSLTTCDGGAGRCMQFMLRYEF